MDPISLEGTEIKSWSPRPAKFNNEGDEIEPPKLQITFLIDMDKVGRFMTRLAWMFRKNVPVTLDISGVEQLPLRDVQRAAREAMSPTEGIESVEVSRIT